jgi:hypothetical protein
MADARKHGLLGDFLDAACATPDGRFAAVYERVGTKALLLRDGGILRELNRSYYQAKAYEYPICIWWNGDHRPLIAHCPEEYCRIDIEDAESGACLNTARTRLLSAGWVWHPLDSVMYFDIVEALHNSKHLDRADNTAPGSFHVGLAASLV